MKEIILSQNGRINKGKFVALVDDEDYERVNQFSWYAQKGNNTYYASSMFFINGKWVAKTLHEFIMGCKPIDHIDSNGLNDQKYNMRKCTSYQNCLNRRPNKKSTSKYKGVGWDNEQKKWRVVIRHNSVRINLGRFSDEIEAAKAYDVAAKIHFKEFAWLNFP